MNRGYTKENYIELIKKKIIYLKFPSTDIIIGFLVKVRMTLDTLDIVKYASLICIYIYLF